MEALSIPGALTGATQGSLAPVRCRLQGLAREALLVQAVWTGLRPTWLPIWGSRTPGTSRNAADICNARLTSQGDPEVPVYCKHSKLITREFKVSGQRQLPLTRYLWPPR